MCAKTWDWGVVGRWEIVCLMNARVKNLHSRINIYYNYYCLFFHLIHIIRLWRMRVRWFFTSCVMNGRKLVLMWVWWVFVSDGENHKYVADSLSLDTEFSTWYIRNFIYMLTMLTFWRFQNIRKKLFNSYFMTTFSCFSIYKHHNFNGKEKISEKSFVIR